MSRRKSKSKARARKTKVKSRRIPEQRTPKFEWVSIEEKDATGRVILPRRALESTQVTVYDQNKHTDLSLRIVTGMAPQGAIIGQYKLYDIKTFDMGGWRMKADAIVELPASMGHEEAWFRAFKGSDVTVSNPGLPGTISEEYIMQVTTSDFGKKVVSSRTESGNIVEKRLFEGRLWMKETIKSTLLRRKGELIRYVGLSTIAAVIGVLIGRLL